MPPLVWRKERLCRLTRGKALAFRTGRLMLIFRARLGLAIHGSF